MEQLLNELEPIRESIPVEIMLNSSKRNNGYFQVIAEVHAFSLQ